MIRLSDSTHEELKRVGRYGDTIDKIVQRLIKNYAFGYVLDNLNVRYRRTLPTRYMKNLCKLDYDARRNGEPDEFTKEELWGEFGGFNIQNVYPVIEHLFLNNLGYITKGPNERISLTKEGRQHCKQDFILPARVKELLV